MLCAFALIVAIAFMAVASATLPPQSGEVDVE